MSILDKPAVDGMTVRELCAKLLLENLSHVQTAADQKPDHVVHTFINIDVSYRAGDMVDVAREMGMLPPALDKKPAVAPAPQVAVYDTQESCPECADGKLRAAVGGGVTCNKCRYWFCY